MSAPAFAPGTLLMAGLLTALTSSQGLLTTASKTGGAYAYTVAAVPFLAELTKLAISGPAQLPAAGAAALRRPRLCPHHTRLAHAGPRHRALNHLHGAQQRAGGAGGDRCGACKFLAC